ADGDHLALLDEHGAGTCHLGGKTEGETRRVDPEAVGLDHGAVERLAPDVPADVLGAGHFPSGTQFPVVPIDSGPDVPQIALALAQGDGAAVVDQRSGSLGELPGSLQGPHRGLPHLPGAATPVIPEDTLHARLDV